MTLFDPFIIPDGETILENKDLVSKQEVLKEMGHFENSRLQRDVPLDSKYREACKRENRVENQRGPPVERDVTDAMSVGKALLKVQFSFSIREPILGRSHMNVKNVERPSARGQA